MTRSGGPARIGTGGLANIPGVKALAVRLSSRRSLLFPYMLKKSQFIALLSIFTHCKYTGKVTAGNLSIRNMNVYIPDT
ncbi:MAG: hypothetical protein A3H23_05240 [Planctomycetes bacterium RIFCSPLOWO2_12_FULL_40_19]|nr:MAG: hypothetical protein A3H23_05240 [Planctomycetes bacterium RIFCSPLOWO2_12_FULL_40_19]